MYSEACDKENEFKLKTVLGKWRVCYIMIMMEFNNPIFEREGKGTMFYPILGPGSDAGSNCGWITKKYWWVYDKCQYSTNAGRNPKEFRCDYAILEMRTENVDDGWGRKVKLKNKMTKGKLKNYSECFRGGLRKISKQDLKNNQTYSTGKAK